MTDGIRLLQWRHDIDARQYEDIKRAGAVESHLHGVASRALADRLLRDSAFSAREEKPDKDDPWGGMRVRVTYSVAVADRSRAGSLATQLAEARVAGLQAGAQIARGAAALYHMHDGGCAAVIASSLADAARAMEGAAAEELARAHDAHSDANK